MEIDAIKKKLKDSDKILKKKFSIKKIGVFGSCARGEQGEKSDIDILVEFFEEPSIFGFIRAERYLTNLLGRKVDLVMKDSLKPAIGKHILEEVIYV